MSIRREPALILALVASTVQLVSAFVFPLSDAQQGVVNALAVAVAGLVTALMVRSDQLAPAILGVLQAAVALGLAFGWAVHAQARPRNSPTAPLLAEWSSTPTDGQGVASAAGDEVRLHIPHTMSVAWTWVRARLQCEITEPGPDGRRERIADLELILDHELVRP